MLNYLGKKMCSFLYSKFSIVLAFIILIASPSLAQIQTLPGSADPSRIYPLKNPIILEKLPSLILPEKNQFNIDAPDKAKQVDFLLKKISFEGVTVFNQKEFIEIYKPYIGKKVPLSILWSIANQITKLYQDEGYFLSRAYVPEQNINSNGIVIIKIVEGYIHDVNLEDKTLKRYALVHRLIQRIKAKKPLKTADLDAFILQLNAFPGVEYRAFIEPIDEENSGYVRLSLKSQKKVARGSVGFDNFGSRFLGPYQAIVTYQDSYLPLQDTTVSLLATAPADELKYIAFRHSMPIYPDWKIEASGNYIKAKPGASLEANDIKSNSFELGVGIHWQPIRQRQETLIASLELAGKNTNGNIFNTNPLTRDRIRTLRTQLTYNANDSWSGGNYSNLSIIQGLRFLGASKEGDLNLSRSEADSDFTVAQFNYTRQQTIKNDFLAIGKISGQIASGPLFAAEEFGYGGQNLGLAYDPSEITGDHGLAAGLELRYLAINSWQNINFIPYTFYDIGKVWNEDIGGIDESGATAGLGMRLVHNSGFNSNLGLAWPLTRSINTPIYGNGKNPRILLQVNYGF